MHLLAGPPRHSLDLHGLEACAALVRSGVAAARVRWPCVIGQEPGVRAPGLNPRQVHHGHGSSIQLDVREDEVVGDLGLAYGGRSAADSGVCGGARLEVARHVLVMRWNPDRPAIAWSGISTRDPAQGAHGRCGAAGRVAKRLEDGVQNVSSLWPRVSVKEERGAWGEGPKAEGEGTDRLVSVGIGLVPQLVGEVKPGLGADAVDRRAVADVAADGACPVRVAQRLHQAPRLKQPGNAAFPFRDLLRRNVATAP